MFVRGAHTPGVFAKLWGGCGARRKFVALALRLDSHNQPGPLTSIANMAALSSGSRILLICGLALMLCQDRCIVGAADVEVVSSNIIEGAGSATLANGNGDVSATGARLSPEQTL